MRKRYLTFIVRREDNLIDRHRLIVFIYASAIMFIGVTVNLCGLSGPQGLFYVILNCSQLVLTLLLCLLWYYQKIKLSFAASTLYIIGQLELSAEMIKCALENSTYSILLIIGNTALSIGVIMMAVISCFRILPYIIVVLSILGYGGCLLITQNDSLENFFPILLLVFFVLSMLGHRQTITINRLKKENSAKKEKKIKELNLFTLNNSQLMAYIALAKEKGLSLQQTQILLDSVGKKAKENIYRNVANHIRQSHINFKLLGKKLPELSPSELQICELILKDMKIKEISKKLKKSESNITCQRTNIRSKLGLQKGDDLMVALRKRMKGRWTTNLIHSLYSKQFNEKDK